MTLPPFHNASMNHKTLTDDEKHSVKILPKSVLKCGPGYVHKNGIMYDMKHLIFITQSQIAKPGLHALGHMMRNII